MGQMALGKHTKFLSFALIALVLSACTLPRSGPTEKEVLASSVENGGDTFIIPVDDEIVRRSRREHSLGFSQAFLSAGTISVDTIVAGDTLNITVWENIDNGIFATEGARVTPLNGIVVDQLGNIFVPYAGTIRAAGRTTEDLRRILTERLSMQTPEPQIEVRRFSGVGATVTMLGGVTGQGVFPIDASTTRLMGMIAKAGGVSLDPRLVKITVRRGGQVGQIWMQDLIDIPANDIPLKPDDRIIIEEDHRYFITMGATGQKRINFETHNPNAIEGLTLSGGLRDNTADPSAIFVLRVEQPEYLNRILGRNDITTPRRVAYVIDLTKESGLFTAQNFILMHEDIVYVTEAEFVRWRDLIRTLIGSINTVSNLDNAIENVGEVFE